MAPVGLLGRLIGFYSKQPEEVPPVLSVQSASLLSLLVTLVYVAPLYLSPATRPSPTLSRDAPSVIQARVRVVTTSCVGTTIVMLVLMIYNAHTSAAEALKLLGWWPIQIVNVLRSLLLLLLLFAGPLFERGIAQGGWRSWLKGHDLVQSLRGWLGWRNYVVGPVSEEIIFRSVIISLHLLAKMSATRIVFLSPLYFGIAHVHHCYEFHLTHPDTPVSTALLTSVFQFGYTTVFGWWAAFLYLRTGSLLAVILAHSFCNWCGLPRLWGRVEPAIQMRPPLSVRSKEDTPGVRIPSSGGQLGIAWTVAYYVLLVAGTVAFYSLLWPLTHSNGALASFDASPT